jgi:hypothetical protein
MKCLYHDMPVTKGFHPEKIWFVIELLAFNVLLLSSLERQPCGRPPQMLDDYVHCKHLDTGIPTALRVFWHNFLPEPRWPPGC